MCLVGRCGPERRESGFRSAHRRLLSWTIAARTTGGALDGIRRRAQTFLSRQQRNLVTRRATQVEKASTKAISLSGKVSADGKTFVSDKDNKTWTVSNPEALKGHEGHEVTLKAHVDEAKSEIHVTSVKMGKG